MWSVINRICKSYNDCIKFVYWGVNAFSKVEC